MTDRITTKLPELAAPPTDYQERGWVAAVPAKALARPNLPAVGKYGDPSCPCCGKDLPEGFIMGRRPPAALQCSRCQQAITWIGWSAHVTRTLQARRDAAARAPEPDFDDEDDDADDDAEAPCICCGANCDPDRYARYCRTCDDQGCGPHG